MLGKFYLACLWTEMSSKNGFNIQPSWLRAWSKIDLFLWSKRTLFEILAWGKPLLLSRGQDHSLCTRIASIIGQNLLLLVYLELFIQIKMVLTSTLWQNSRMWPLNWYYWAVQFWWFEPQCVTNNIYWREPSLDVPGLLCCLDDSNNKLFARI